MGFKNFEVDKVGLLQDFPTHWLAKDILLAASKAASHGSVRYGADRDCIGSWMNPKDWVSWENVLAKAGAYRVEITYACQKGAGGSDYAVAIGDQTVTGRTRDTGEDWYQFVTETLGTVKLTKLGQYTLSIRPKSKPGQAVMNLRRLALRGVSE